MKKILSHLTGILSLTTILIAGACNPDSNPVEPEDMSKVEIKCKAVVDNGVLKFEMHNADDDKKVVATPSKDDPAKLVADLVTDVEPRTRVTWIWADDSDIDKFVKIGPRTPGPIIPGNAKKVLFSKNFRLRIPREATAGEESYYIEFKDLDGNTVTIDPYLKIR